ncbi:hypothetical protein [Pseudomonas yamanorum]|uniref:hypothetical protein n=1 Tax=Pseudomonas yamanorum TaxID=515393 RepID=UPI00087DA967|nr:hypothetical protein [Pseudomonas yamanorum]SDT99452.1 hypothetical protein SAMN05216237_1181 [Pseudomonas yamanorum]
MTSKTELSNCDYENTGAFLGKLLEAYKTSKITKECAAESLANVMTSLEKGNYVEAWSWFKQRRKNKAPIPTMNRP